MMTRQDAPYAVFVAICALAIFVAGRMTAPTPEPAERIVTVREAAPPPSIIIVPSAAPMVSHETPPVSLAIEPVPSPPASNAPKAGPLKVAPATSKPVAPEPIILEEDVPNPYKAANTPGF